MQYPQESCESYTFGQQSPFYLYFLFRIAMASVIGHTVVALCAAKTFDTFSTKKEKATFWILSIICSVFPDSDIVSFNLGIPYEHMLGHRGFSHSLLFGILFGGMIAWFYCMLYKKHRVRPYWIFFALLTLSHGILDAMTSGGRGIGFFIPFSAERFFLPFRPLLVSPIGAGRFFSEWGLKVLMSEMLWLGLPGIFVWLATTLHIKSKQAQI